jgi:flagellar hook-associated protein FlgK
MHELKRTQLIEQIAILRCAVDCHESVNNSLRELIRQRDEQIAHLSGILKEIHAISHK